MYDIGIDDFNPELQLRCDFIRGKSLSNMEDYLSVYVNILSEICPIAEDLFADAFDNRFAHAFRISTDDNSEMKKVKNHRTENVTKILGLVYKYNGIVYLSKRTEKYIKDNDQPALFKSVCFQFQQPNGSQTINAFIEKTTQGINFRPFHFIIKLLKIAYEDDIRLTKDDLFYYVLNCKQTLQGRVAPEVVYAKILQERAEGKHRKVALVRNQAWTTQHLREQLDYLSLANLIRMDKYSVYLNMREIKAIKIFEEELSKPLRFNYLTYDTRRPGIFDIIENDWLYYMGVSEGIDLSVFNTTATSFDSHIEENEEDHQNQGESTVELGDRGEAFVMNYEKKIVGEFNKRLVNKVNYLGNVRGLGYDITSIEANRADCREDREKIRYIEVKTTARVTPPNPDFQDSINLTRNEWVAAEQQKEHFYIYRLYFTNKGPYLYIIKNPCQKNEDGSIYVTPTAYHMEYEIQIADELVTFKQDE